MKPLDASGWIIIRFKSSHSLKRVLIERELIHTALTDTLTVNRMYMSDVLIRPVTPPGSDPQVGNLCIRQTAG